MIQLQREHRAPVHRLASDQHPPASMHVLTTAPSPPHRSTRPLPRRQSRLWDGRVPRVPAAERTRLRCDQAPRVYNGSRQSQGVLAAPCRGRDALPGPPVGRGPGLPVCAHLSLVRRAIRERNTVRAKWPLIASGASLTNLSGGLADDLSAGLADNLSGGLGLPFSSATRIHLIKRSRARLFLIKRSMARSSRISRRRCARN